MEMIEKELKDFKEKAAELVKVQRVEEIIVVKNPAAKLGINLPLHSTNLPGIYRITIEARIERITE